MADDEYTEEDGALKIQAIARGRKSRRRTADRGKTEKKERELAASRLQARQRGRNSRQAQQLQKEMTAAALTIQTLWRGRKERQKLSTRLKGGRKTTDVDIKKGLYQLGRSPFTLRHAFISLRVNAEYVNDISAIEQYACLQTVEMRNNLIVDVTSLRALPFLTSLNLSRNKLTEVLAFSPPRCAFAPGGGAWATGDRHIGSLLREADLSFNEIETIRDVAEHGNLAKLVLDHNLVCDIGAGLRGLSALQTLHLSHNRIARIGGLEGLPLEELAVDHNEIEQLETLDTLPRLQRLFAAHNKLTSLDGLQKCAQLTLVDVADNALSVVRQVEWIKPLPMLTTLTLAGNELAGLPFYRLRVVMRLQRITLLDGMAVTSEEKVKAINLYGGDESDVGHRADVFAKIFPTESFQNHLPPFVETEESPIEIAAAAAAAAAAEQAAADEQEIFEGDIAIEGILKTLEKGKDALFEVMSMLPPELCEHLDSPEFQLSCHEQFDALDEDRSGSLTVDELYPVIAELAGTREWVVTEEQCSRFANIFDEDGNGDISKSEFVAFMQFALAMLHCEQQRKAAEAEEEIFEGDMAIEGMLAKLEEGKDALFEIMSMLPPDLGEYLDSSEFQMTCHEQFDGLDEDRSGSLTVDELYPVIAELAGTREWVVTEDQCTRFANLFDEDGNGDISKSEFVSFMQYAFAMLHCEQQRLAAEAQEEEEQEIIEGDAAIEGLLAKLETGKDALFEVMSMLPPDLAEHLDSSEFQLTCHAQFDGLDADGSGSLTIDELYPVIASLAGTREWIVTEQQCTRFAKIFDEDGNGDISKSEFVGFMQFAFAMLHCEQQRG